MSKNIIQRLDRLDNFIRTKSTGTPQQLAGKLNVCERQVREYISLFRDLGAPVKYCRKRNTYYYESEGMFNFKFDRVKEFSR